MSKMSNVSDNSFTPFQSGCSKCYPSTDYYSVKTGGSDGNYSNDGLIPKSNGENLYVEQEFNKQMDSNFIKKNYGIDYKTANGGKKSKKGGSYNIDSEENHNVIPGIGGSKKSMKGGMESSGATPLPQRFFNPTLELNNSQKISGTGTMSAYGQIDSEDIGTGMLAPYNASTCSTVNPNSTMKTGGKKLVKKIGGASGLIPKISDKPISTVQKTINGAISGFSNFINKLDQDYLKSVSYVKTVKIGNQRLIQGGKKDKKKVQKKKIIKKGGSNGSDFALTLNSRGPVNAPDDFWGVPGEKWFKQFNKTGEYIPNSKLAYAATPLLAGIGNSPEVTAYDSLGTDYGSV